MRKRGFLECFLVLLLIFSMGMAVEEVPNPQTERSSYVQDSAGVLGPQYIGMIDNISRLLEATTGAELAVVTVDNLNESSIEEFAARLFKRFGIGKKEKNNGVLILFSLYDKKVRIEVGYGLEGILTDAYSSRIIWDDGIPRFKQNNYAQGLFIMARRVALKVAQGEEKELAIPLPAQWPPQVAAVVKAPSRRLAFSKKEGVLSIPNYLMSLFGLIILLMIYKTLRFYRVKAKATKRKILDSFYAIPLFMWVGGGIGALFTGGILGHMWATLLPFLGTSGAMSFAYKGLKKHFKKKYDDYHLPCNDCKNPMDIVSEADDNAFLTPEEIAEERVEGMDYEFWRCHHCNLEVRFAVKLWKASPCKKCSRRTLVRTSQVISSATTTSTGTRRITETCHNPNCNYQKTWTRTIARLASSSGSSGGFSSGGGSFGGGSSGGGGASGGW